MSVSGIKVLLVGCDFHLPYDTMVNEDPRRIFLDVAGFRPDVVVTSGNLPSVLSRAPFALRKRWIDVPPNSPSEDVCRAVEQCYSFNIWSPHPHDADFPLVSVYTCTYNTGDLLRDTYQSLREQTYSNWEWCVVDDGSTDGTAERIMSLAQEDFRVRPFLMPHQGKIGYSKDVATRLARGEFLVELDHDDMLADDALQEVVSAFQANPDVGMVYSNCASFFPDGSPQQFTDDFWRQRYRDTEYRGKVYKEAVNPNIYDRFGDGFDQQFAWFLTVGPNHVRAFRASIFRELGGYNPNLPVADDWDLFARFFLYSKCLHLDKMLYLYRYHDSWKNTTFLRNKAIQDHLALGRQHYRTEFERVNSERLSGSNNRPVVSVSTDRDIRVCCPVPEGSLVLGYISSWTGRVAAGVSCPEFDKSDQPSMADLLRLLLAGTTEATLIVHPSLKIPISGNSFQDIFARCSDKPIVFQASAADNPSLVYLPPDASIDYLPCWFHDPLCSLAAYLKKIQPQTEVVMESFVPCISDNKKASVPAVPALRHRLSLIMITLNERPQLERIVPMYREAGVDSICILDSGSTDGTKEWASANGVYYSERKFTNFAEQRNAALSVFAKPGDMVVMQDPDEIPPQEILSRLVEISDCFPYDVLHLRLKDSDDKEWVPKPYLFRMTNALRWKLPVHEKLIGGERQILIKDDIFILHDLSAHDQARRDRNAIWYNELGCDHSDLLLDGFPVFTYRHPRNHLIPQVHFGPGVSVVIPTHNRPQKLLKALESALAQDYFPFEVLVVNDGGPVPETLIQIPDSLRLLLWVISLDTNHGAGGAYPRNVGIAASRFPLIAYLDDDNRWKPNHLSSLVSLLSPATSGVISSMELESNSVPLIFKRKERGQVDTSCMLHRKHIVLTSGWWKSREEVGYAHDWEFCSRWPGEVAFTKLPTVIYGDAESPQQEWLLKQSG